MEKNTVPNPPIQFGDGENPCTTYCNTKGEAVYICTEKTISVGVAEYTLYQIIGKKKKKLGKGDSPIALEKKYGITPLAIKQA